ncbi:MAG: hypothetical protein ACOYXB_07120 [Bacteroidota bacterium]
MKKADLYVAAGVILFFLPFFIFPALYEWYETTNREHGLLMSFVKFALLAPLGEVIGLRIRTGRYNTKGFGILARAVVWGFLGMTVKMAFVIFGEGAPVLMEVAGIKGAAVSMQGDFSWLKLFTAFTISTSLNLFYAPVLMTVHRITDTHIMDHGGKFSALFIPIRFGEIMGKMDWHTMWHFVFKKTIPLFWIPAQTLNFMLPPDVRILVAALYSVVLGILLAVASQLSKKG